MSSFVVAVLAGIGVLALLVFAFRSSRSSRVRQGEAADSGFAQVPDSPAFAGLHGSDCSDSASDGGGCDGGGGD